MSQDRYVLGLNCAHDAAACILKNGQIAVGVAEERLNRVKHYEGFPALSLEYCLTALQLSNLNDIDCIVVNEYPETDHSSRLRSDGYRGRLVTNPSHHHLHALYAVAASGWQDTAVLVLDGSGYSYAEYLRRGSELLGAPPELADMEEAESSFFFDGDGLSLVHKRWGAWESNTPFYRFPSLGHLFSGASQYIFGHMSHAGKTMGLAPFGDSTTMTDSMVTLTSEGIDVHTDWILGLPVRSDLSPEHDAVCLALAAKVQAEVEKGILHLVDLLLERTGTTRLCLSGGVALNSVANGRILRDTACTALFVTPAAGDSGVAIGAAVLAESLSCGETPSWNSYSDHLGRSHRSEVASALSQYRGFVDSEACQDAAAEAASDLAEGLIIAWFGGGSEMGPRALGNRSILAHAGIPGMRDRINERVKFREPFRPYAASVLAEDVGTYFLEAPLDPFMLTVVEVRESQRAAIASVCHVDNTCRIQAVFEADGSSLRSILTEFRSMTGFSLILNTSFNVRGEPIVESPSDAMLCFLTSNIDVLYIEGQRIVRSVRRSEVDAGRSGYPVALGVRGLHSTTTRDPSEGTWSVSTFTVETRTGYRMAISRDDEYALRLADGRTSTAEMARLGVSLESLRRLEELGLLTFRAG